MFPAESADSDCCNYSHHHEPYSSSAMSTAISADTSSLYLQQHHHYNPHHPQHHHLHDQYIQQDQQKWPHLFYYTDSDLASARSNEETLVTAEDYQRQQYNMQQGAAAMTGNLSREEQQLIAQQIQPSYYNAVQFQGATEIPAVEQYYYNEQQQPLRSGMGMQGRGVEPRMNMYESHIQELQMANEASSSASVLLFNRNVESIGRLASNEPAAARYEEACTPRPRWCPTQEQIQILEALFSTGTTTPSRDMIVDIAAQLRKYGTIAEANVFYWFQNRKARAKRRLQPARAPYTPCSSAP